jgi:hypothetical protein
VEENPSNVSPNSGSLPDINLHTATGDERLMGVLYKKIEDLAKEVHELKTKKIIDETQMPPELLEQSGMLPPDPTRVERGRGFRPLLRSEIEEAIKVSPFCSDQAKHLGVCIGTYRKYAKPLGLWKPQPHHRGSRKSPWGPEKGKYPLSKILKGEYNGNKLVTDWMVKHKVLKAGATEACAICGYNKKHLINGRVPLLLDHIDGDKQNFKAENIRLLCWNCTVECGRGYLRRGIHFFDPDWRTDGKE